MRRPLTVSNAVSNMIAEKSRLEFMAATDPTNEDQAGICELIVIIDKLPIWRDRA